MNVKELPSYFKGIERDLFIKDEDGFERIGDKTDINFSDGEFCNVYDADVVMFSVDEYRGAGKQNNSDYTDGIRKEFYGLYPSRREVKVCDLGRMTVGAELRDTYFLLSEICGCLFELGKTVIVLGGGDDLSLGVYKGYSQIGRIINMVGIDSRFDLTGVSKDDGSIYRNWLEEIMTAEPNYLFDYTLLGYQSYYVEKGGEDLLDDLYFERYRLGLLQGKLEKTEPILRDCDFISVDTGCLRKSDCKESISPHGFYGEELCKLLHYGGLSDKLSCLLISGFAQNMDSGCKITAHGLYYFLEGYTGRMGEVDIEDNDNYLRFEVLLNPQDGGGTYGDDGKQIEKALFYKSKLSDRWWVVVPCSDELKKRYRRHYIVPCEYKDYQEASKGKLPMKWIKAYNKLNR